MYSQRDEEQVITAQFAGRTGRFLDIGAYDGITFSTTRRLFELGWSGVLVEPSPQAFVRLMALYGGDCRAMLVNAAVDPQPGLKGFHASADGVSTLLDAHREKWVENWGAAFVPIVVNTVSPAALLALVDGRVDFVNLDVEGENWDMLVSLDWEALDPEMACVETDGRFDDMAAFFKERGYWERHRTAENLMVVKGG